MKKWLAQVALVFMSLVFLGMVFGPVAVFAQGTTNNVETTGSGAFVAQKNLLPVCSVSPADDGGSIEGCAVRLVYYAVLYPSSWLAGIGGSVFDWFTAYTLSSDSYSQAGFVERGWRIVRDIANLSFIFVLLYIAFRYVLGLEGRDVQKTLVKILGTALILNFSLFTTRVIIDAGNILGRVFYEKITVTGVGENNSSYIPLSVGLISKVNPQRLLTQEMFDPQTTIAAGTVNDNNTLGETNGQIDSKAGSIGFMILVLVVAAVINLAIAYVLFSVGIFFVARTIGLWFQMILSPLAFLSIAIPKVGGAAGGRFDFSKWLATTFSLSFMMVVFMFFLYLIIMFLDVAFGSLVDTSSNASGFTLFLEVTIPFVVVIILLLAAKKQAKEMSGEFGGAIVKGLKYAVLGALGTAGLALGGAAIIGGAAGRQTLGRLGTQMTKKEATTGLGRARVRAGKYLQSSTFDARNVKIPKPLTSGFRSTLSYATGQELGSGDFAMNMNRLGGPSSRTYKTLKEQRIKEQTEKAKDYAGSDSTVVDTQETSYTHTDVNGKKSTVTVAGRKVSVSEAESILREKTRQLEEEKERIHRDQDYEGKKQSLADAEKEFEKQEKKLAEKQKKLDEMMRRKQSGDTSVTQALIDSVRSERDAEKIVLGRRERSKRDAQNIVRGVEVMYRDQENAVEESKAVVGAAKRALREKNAEIYNNYADALESWSYMPNPPVNYRGPGDRGAASNVRNMVNREEDKSK